MMPVWKPEKVWQGQDAFVIGGGKSLEFFNWDLLKRELTIGCNAAYALGADVCKVCVFGDNKFFRVNQKELAKYKGVVFTNLPSLLKSDLPWLWTMPRQMRGLHVDALGWNQNTGYTAINLALLLGAKRVFLLGFDMRLTKGKANWHDKGLDKPNEGAYKKFMSHDQVVLADWKSKFGDVEIVNVTDDSKLGIFPKAGVDAFWKERMATWATVA
jgi:hypothetical protein